MGPTCSKTTPPALGPPRASVHLKTGWGTQPRIVLSNKSPYRVSYWVLQEDKQRKTAHRRRTIASFGLNLSAGITGGSTSADMSRKEDDTVEVEETTQYLMTDHRMEPNGEALDTEVPFPVGCQELRVYACFEEDGQWKRYKDKVYSVAQRRRSVLLTALGANIAPYSKGRSKSADLGQTSGGCSKCRLGSVKQLIKDNVISMTKKAHCNTM